ncbi:Ig-like domain-containing protein [Halioxenophilus aromaticivorans]|uniref:Uncharacterized protein n=1 Tax=Halioxenophilus aromaticivorans TaxID=1306992 RepID=A0AAV3U6P4_9ALTE
MENLSTKHRMPAVSSVLALSVSLLTATGGEAATSSNSHAFTEQNIALSNLGSALQQFVQKPSLFGSITGMYEETTDTAVVGKTGTTATEKVDSPQASTAGKPTIALAFSESGYKIAKGTTVTITANAADKNGRITKVGFYKDGVWVGKDTKAPYTHTWKADKNGTYTIYAKTTDNHGLTTTSTKYTFTVTDKATGNENPEVALISPTAGASIDANSNITLSANAFDNDGSITKVAFFANGKWLGKDTTKPYTFDWNNVPEGTHTVYARATDNKNGMATSASVKLTANATKKLQPPAITLTAPNDVAAVDLGDSITIKANASDTDGNIKKVAFYSNGSLLGTDSTSPFAYTWTNANAGSHDIYAIATDSDGLTATSDTHRVSVNEKVSGKLVTYPANADVASVFKSSKFAVNVSQGGSTKNSFVYKSENTANPGWKGTLDYMQDANHWTTFSFDGKVVVEARRLDGKAIENCIVRPLSLNIKPQIQGNKCSFELNQQAKLSVEIDEPTSVTRPITGIGTVTKEIVKNPLFVFAQPLETDVPTKSDDDTIYFGPGIHEIGKGYTIPNNKEVYIAGGAVVIGTMSGGYNPTNVKIRGRGLLTGYGLSESKSEHNSWGNHSIAFTSGSRGSGLEIEGITISDPLRSCIVSYNKVDIRNVSLFSWNHRNDGITAGNNSTIENGFIKVQDDNLKLYYSNQTVRNMVIWQQTAGSVFKFSWNLRRVAQNNLVENIDIIHSDVFTDYAPAEVDRADLQSKSAIFSAMGFQRGSAFQNNTFKGIRIEEEHLLRLMSLRMVTTHAGPVSTDTWGNPSPSAVKTIDNVVIEDLSLAKTPYKQSTLYGNAGGKISNIKFNNLRIDNQLINGEWALTSKLDGTGLTTAGNVSKITFGE